MRRTGIFAAALVLAVAVGCNKGNETTKADGSTVGTAGRAENAISSGDRDFVRDVAAMNIAEVDLARLATERGAGADVKEYAQMMLNDHPAAGDKLKAFAAQRGIEVPITADDKARDDREKLAAKTGIEFDREFADKMVDSHQAFVDKLASRIDRDTITKTTIEKDNAPDAKVKATAVMPEKSDDANTFALNQWAAETYPVAYAHLEAAKALRDGVKKRATN